MSEKSIIEVAYIDKDNVSLFIPNAHPVVRFRAKRGSIPEIVRPKSSAMSSFALATVNIDVAKTVDSTVPDDILKAIDADSWEKSNPVGRARA